VLAWLWWRTLRTRKWPVGTAALTAILLAAIYGVLDEVHQYFVPGRFLSLTDLAMNLVGALLGGAWALLRDRAFVPTRPTY
jgi:VanZ family protein